MFQLPLSPSLSLSQLQISCVRLSHGILLFLLRFLVLFFRIRMGFPVGYTEVIIPNLFLHLLPLLGHIRSLISSLFHFLGLSDFLETDADWPETQSRISGSHSVSALLLRELLPVIKFSELLAASGGGESPESCALCLYEFEGGEEIRKLPNCKHIFHRDCLDRWMDHDQKTCPLCRTPFLQEEMLNELNQRLWAATGVSEFGSV